MTVPVGRAPGCIKTGGRVKNSLDRGQRELVSSQLAASIMATFELLGGTAAMFEWASNNQTIFYTQILSRLMPAAQKPADVEINVGMPAGELSEREAAIRIAFILSKAAYEQKREVDIKGELL